MKLSGKLLLILHLLFLSNIAHTEISGCNIRVGVDYFGYKERGYIDRPGYFVGSEILWKQLTQIPGHQELGLGIEYQFPRGNEDKFNFIPVYGIMRFNITSQKNISLTKLVFRIGYNWFEGEDRSDHYDVISSDNYGGGVYYGIGIDHIIKNNFIFGIYATENIGTNRITPFPEYHGLSKKTVYIRYRKVNFSIGYVFN